MPGKGNEQPSVRVLVVDDEPMLCDLACSWLEASGYVATGFTNGVDALQALENAAFDVLFTDLIMPGSMSGIDLARRVTERWPQVRVMVTSGYSNELGAVAVHHWSLLSKPYRREELVRAMQRLTPAAR